MKRIEELQGERTKIIRKEMVLAVVGTMKAGKSTTINAIVGKEILPNRNRPMTSIPTLIRHVPGKHTPDLQLNNIDPIHQLLSALKKKITTDEGKKRVRGLRSNGTETYDNGINMLYLKCFYLGLTLSGTKTYVKV